MADQKVAELPAQFYCEKCDYKCSREWLFKRHKLTRKHQNADKMLTLTDQKGVKGADHVSKNICICEKEYEHKQSLFKHKKKCILWKQFIEKKKEGSSVSDDLVMELIKQNKELQQMLCEQNNKIYELAKEGKYITNNNNMTNNNTTNNFNLNVFLNDQCKDAISLLDFVDSLQVNVNHLEYTAQVGYVEGMSHIFIDGLKDIDVHYRPIHCSDFRREIFYIKNGDKWEKEDDYRTGITKAIKLINNKSLKQIIEWQKMYPDYNDPDSKQNDRYMKMLCNVMSGSTEEEQKNNMNKIIKNVAKEVVINKKNK
jgi:hypothetical protein